MPDAEVTGRRAGGHASRWPLKTTAELQDDIRILEAEVRWNRQLADTADRDFRRVRREHPADGLTMIRLLEEKKFRRQMANQFAKEARALRKRI